MLIKIHKIKKFKNYWKVRFTSERNQNGIEISTPVFDDYDKLVKHIEKYIENNIPIVEEPELEVDSSEIVLPEPEPTSEPEHREPTPEELQLQEMHKELNELVSQKEALANQIKSLLEGWKLDIDLVKLKEAFNISDETFLDILENKKSKKTSKYIEIKTQYEDLKQQIANKEAEIRQFVEDNGLEYMY